MSDLTPEHAPAEPAEPAAIDFDRAEPVDPGGLHVACGVCAREITTEYWQSFGKVLCETCRAGVEQATAQARRGATFGRALLLGGGAALGCGIGYAVFVGVSHIQFALVTIGIGWAIGRVIQKVTRGFGSPKFQVLAVALTYFASTMGYLPAVLKGLAQGSEHAKQTAAAASPTEAPSASPSSASTVDPPPVPGRDGARPTATEAPAPPGGEPGLAVSLVIFTAFTGLFMLAAPFLELGDGFSGLLGLLIIFFGMRTAWRVSKGVEVIVTGPHRVAPAAGS